MGVASDIFAKDGVHRRLQVLYRPATETNNAKPFKLILEVVESESRHFFFYIKMIFFSFYVPVSVACQKIQKKRFNSGKNDNVIKTLLHMKGVSNPTFEKLSFYGKWYRIYGSSCASLT